LILCNCLRTILQATASCSVPLGVSVESVSIFREEIDAAHDLFVKLQALMLDGNGIPWKVKWVYTVPISTPEERAFMAAQAAAMAAARPAAVGAGAVVSAARNTAEVSGNQILQVLLALGLGFMIGAHRS
jgi:hypothetical protein